MEGSVSGNAVIKGKIMAQSLVTKLLHLLKCWEGPGIQVVPKTGHLSRHTEAHSSSQICGHCQGQGDFIKGCTACKHEMQVARDASEVLFQLCSSTSFPRAAAPRFYTREEAQPSPATREGQDTHSAEILADTH